MNKFILFSAIAVLALPASVTRAYDIWTNPPKASCNFEYKYEGDALPTNPPYTNLGFVFVDTYNTGTNYNRIETNDTVKYLVIRDPAGTNNYYYAASNSPAWHPATMGPFTLEIRIRIDTYLYATPSLQMIDGRDRHNFTMYTNKVIIQTYASVDSNYWWAGTTYSGQENSNTFHTFRIANFSYNDTTAGQSNVVWRDGILLGVTTGNDADSTNGLPKLDGIPQLMFGSTYGATGCPWRFDIDYIRWTTNGAYPWKADPPAGTVISIY